MKERRNSKNFLIVLENFNSTNEESKIKEFFELQWNLARIIENERFRGGREFAVIKYRSS